ncbi:MAG: NAD(P)H-binding protein, partial [Acidobacteriia bacterium]|nr:NAD(P)H-binding protein [Terriglobia bacterium]
MVFLTGATGYMGQRLAGELLRRGHRVRALVRSGSEHKLPAGCEATVGDALQATTFANALAGCHTLVQLVDTPHPAPWKETEFRAVDLVSAKAFEEHAQVAENKSHAKTQRR